MSNIKLLKAHQYITYKEFCELSPTLRSKIRALENKQLGEMFPFSSYLHTLEQDTLKKAFTDGISQEISEIEAKYAPLISELSDQISKLQDKLYALKSEAQEAISDTRAKAYTIASEAHQDLRDQVNKMRDKQCKEMRELAGLL